MTFVPPLLFALFYPEGFIVALKYAGIFVVILLAFLPALMAWFERYGAKEKQQLARAEFEVFGGKFMLGFTLAFSLMLLVIEVVA